MKCDPATDIPLVLGGHSFISQLGNDLPASDQERYAIVESCLDCGIRWFDTTYQPERIALGRVLRGLGRRHEASILAWNFFSDFLPSEQLDSQNTIARGTLILFWNSCVPTMWIVWS